MKRRLMILIAAVAIIALLLALGPRPSTDGTIRFDSATIGEDVDAYLAASEAKLNGLRPGTEKEVVWANADKRKTQLSVIYLHGFSASKMESRPFADDLARAIGANLYYARLAGHGGNGEDLANVEFNDWANDVAEAMAIGRRIGERVVVIGNSTGAALAVWAAARSDLASDMHALVLLSPNFAVRGASTGLLNMPWGPLILPLYFGATRSFEPHNAGHAKWWTTSYPSRAVFPMAALLRATAAIRFEDITVPAMFIYSPSDTVIQTREVERVYRRWGGKKQIKQVTDAEDPSQHAIVGDILSPSTTAPVLEETLAWLNSLPPN
jgi:alpha-beta hydrolase superfamily lysophospholipase